MQPYLVTKSGQESEWIVVEQRSATATAAATKVDEQDQSSVWKIPDNIEVCQKLFTVIVFHYAM